MKLIYRFTAVPTFILSALIGFFGLYMSGQELGSLYLRTASYHMLTGQNQQTSHLLGTVSFVASHLFTSLFTVGIVLMVTSFFSWRLARKLWAKTTVQNK